MIRGKRPRPLATRTEDQAIKRYALAKKRRDALKATAHLRRAAQSKQTTDKDYGSRAEEPDLTAEAYATEVRIQNERLNELRTMRDSLERETVQQWQSMRWLHVRKDLLTASRFGKVCTMRKNTSCKNIVTSILYSNLSSKVPALEWGRSREIDAREELENQVGVQVRNCGLFVHPEILGLGATPDGLIDDDGIVEIKCPYSARRCTLDDAIQQKLAGLHRIFSDASCTAMNPKHEYYFQVQGQLEITRRNYCLFMVWTPHGSKIVKVPRDEQFWKSKMERRLVQFYEDCLLPEIVDSRYKRSMPIRDPPYVIEAQNATKRRRQQKLEKLANKEITKE